MLITPSKYFTAEEVFHPSYIKEFGVNVWAMRPAEIWHRLDCVREAWGGPLWVNHDRQVNMGVRERESATGRNKSHHKPIYQDDQAFDLHASKNNDSVLNRKLYDWVISEGWKAGWIRRVEHIDFTLTWVHIEIFTRMPVACHIFRP